MRVEGALAPKLKPPPVGAVDAAAVVAWTFVAPKLKAPNERPPAAVVAAGAIVAAGASWV